MKFKEKCTVVVESVASFLSGKYMKKLIKNRIPIIVVTKAIGKPLI